MSGYSWTALVGAALAARLVRRRALLSDRAYWHRRTAAIQLAQLHKLLTTAQRTRFGRAHGFDKLAALEPGPELLAAYRASVAVRDYEAFRADIIDMRERATPDVLWPGLVEHYAQTSGTTAGDKFMPVSKQMMRSNFLAAMDIFANAQRQGVSLTGLLSGKALFLGGSTDLETNQHGIKTGDLSGLVTPMIRWPLSSIYLPGREIALMSRWPEKIDAMARVSVNEDVRMISGMPSWMLVLFERVMQLAREQGRRAECLRDVWPNLQLIVHGGVKYAPFDPRVRAAWSGSSDGPDVPHRLELYPASEGFVAMQDEPGDPGLRLLTDIGNFYEFVPLERVHDADPPAMAAWEVDKGQRYVVCMSTCAGFWRYILGDVVEFDTIPARPDGTGGDGPARLRIVGRHRHFVNAFGENLIVEHIENAVAQAARASGLVVGEFTAAPVYPGQDSTGTPRRAGLELVVEMGPEAGERAIGGFAESFDAALKAQNVDYTTKRTDNLGMGAPTITPIALGTIHRWMDQRGKLGGQHKCPRCANHREYVDGILSAARGRAEITTGV